MSEQDTQVQGSENGDAAEETVLDISDAVDFETLQTGDAKSADGQPAPGTDAAQPPASDEAEQAPVEPSADQQSPTQPTDETAQYLAQFPKFSYKADGKEHEVEGAHMAENGAFFTPKALQWLRDQLATAHAHNGSWQRELAKARRAGADEAQRTIETRERQVAARTKAADVITAKMMELAEAGEEVAWDWFQNFRANLPRLLAESERAQTQAERDEIEREKSERAGQELRRQQDGALDYLMGEYGKTFPGVDVARIRARLDLVRDRVFPKDPATGEPLVDYGLIEDEFKYAAEMLGAAREVRANASKATQAGQANAAATKTAVAPPAVAPRAGARGTAPAGGLRGKKFKTREEFEEYLNSGKADAEALEMLQTMSD